MLAPPVWIDRPVETDIGRLISCYDLFWLFNGDLGFQRWKSRKTLPAIIRWHAFVLLEPGSRVESRAPAAPPVVLDTGSAIVAEEVARRPAVRDSVFGRAFG